VWVETLGFEKLMGQATSVFARKSCSASLPPPRKGMCVHGMDTTKVAGGACTRACGGFLGRDGRGEWRPGQDTTPATDAKTYTPASPALLAAPLLALVVVVLRVVVVLVCA
jgi:hypothetical protein